MNFSTGSQFRNAILYVSLALPINGHCTSSCWRYCTFRTGEHRIVLNIFFKRSLQAMAKTSSGQNIASQITKQSLHGIKNGSIKKDKKPKFKNTPTGKISLLDNAKTKKSMTTQINFQKNTDIKNNQNSSTEKIETIREKENSSKRKQNLPKGKQHIPKGKHSPNKSQNQQGGKKNNLTPKEVNDSDSDVNEKETNLGDETLEDEEYDTDVPDIFGTSLAENSDLDDEDFEEEEKGDEESEEDESEEDESEEDESEEDESSEDEDKDILNPKVIQPSSNLESCKSSKDNVYEDDEQDDEDNEDDDDSESDEDIDTNEMDISVFQSDDDEDEDEDESEIETSDLKALLGKSMTDDDDDEDFNEEGEDDEDDDISEEEDDDNDNDDDDDDDEDDDEEEEDDNAVKVIQDKTMKDKATKISNSKDTSKKNNQTQEKTSDDKRTIFIDNIPKETKTATLKKIFGQYGPINNIRFRGIVPNNLKMSKKVAAIKKDIHPKLHTVVAYINYESEESAKKALCMNGKKFEGNYINVRIVAKSEQNERDNKKAIFIGNLKFGMDTNPIWEHFSKCGEIDSVRLIRDNKTGQTRGFGYVNFKSEDSVALALKLNGIEIDNRPVRVSLCKDTSKKQQKPINQQGRKNKSSPLSKNDDNSPSKKFKNNSQQAVAHSTGEVKVKQKKSQKDNTSFEEKIAKSFQGQKGDVKDKKKGGKFNKKKKEMAGKLTAKPKKQKS